MKPLMTSLPFLITYLYFIIPLAPIVYIFIKWRSYRDAAPPDPQLGTKVILYYFKTLAYHVCLASLALLFVALLKGDNGRSILMPLGVFLSGGVIYAIHGMLIHKLTNTVEFPQASRIYTGFNLVIVGLVGMVSFAAASAILFGEGTRNIKEPLAIFIVYIIAWVFQTISFCKQPNN